MESNNKMSMLGFICGLELEKIKQHRSDMANQLQDPIEEKLQPLVLQSTTNGTEQRENNEERKPFQYTERASRATGINPNTFEFGRLKTEIVETVFMKSDNRYIWSIIKGKGKILIKVTNKSYDPKITDDPTLIRATLIRKSESYRHLLVQEICPKHISCSDPRLRNHVMQTDNSNGNHWYETTGIQKSICFNMRNPFQEIISLRFICGTNCNTTGQKCKMNKTNKALLLILTMEQNDLIIGRKTIEICPKSAM